MNASELLVETLSSSGVENVFGIPGNSLLDSTDYIFKTQRLRFITVRHEQVAASMAEGYARVTRVPGVCFAGAGPSAANLLIGVANAYRASTPMIAVTGNLEREKLGRGSLNEWNQMEMFGPITKVNVQLTDPARLPDEVRSALLASVSGRPGPVHLDLPADVGRKEVEPLGRMSRLEFGPTRAEPPAEQVRKTLDLLRAAERPVLIAGGGAFASGAGFRLRRLAELLQIPVGIGSARGILSEDHPLCFGPVGVWGYSACNDLVGSADLIVGLGFRFADDSTMGWKTIARDSKIVQVDIDLTEIGKQYDVTLGVVSDVDTFLNQLLRALKEDATKQRTGWPPQRLKALQSSLAEERESLVSGPFEDEPVDKRVILREVMRALGEDAYVVAGTGVHTRYASRMIVRQPGHFLRSGAFAAMGFAFPAAMGVKVAKPQSQVVCLDGDGDFMMTVQDFETAVRENLPFVTVVFNNSSYAAYKFARFRGRRVGVEFGNPDFVRLAQSFGGIGERVTRSADFGPTLKRLMDAGEPAILDALVTNETDLPWY